MSGDVVFDLRNASAGFGGPLVLDGIDLRICRGECVAIMGRSGAGKSTLLGLLHHEKPDSIALIPQAAALVGPLSVFHNVFMGRLDRYSTAYNLRTLISPARREIGEIDTVLQDVGLADKIFVRAGSLSGGQQQRTSVARAIYNGRPIVLGDEAVSALDAVQASEILATLRVRHETLVLALHDVNLALKHTDRIVVLDGGRKIIDTPSHAITAAELLAHFGGNL